MITYEQHEANYNLAYARAVNEKRCFCFCGCELPVEHLSVIGGPVICPACGGDKLHGLTRRPVETYDWDAWEAANPTPEYVEAEEYVRKVGPTAGPRLRSLADMLARGERFHEGHIESVLRSKAVAKRGDEAAVKRIARAARHSELDLDRVLIPAGVPEGDYAVVEAGEGVHVRIERPVEGLVAGWTVVTFMVGQAEPLVGLQRPQPWRDADLYPNWYVGPYAHLVHAVVEDPESAASLYKQLEGVAA